MYLPLQMLVLLHHLNSIPLPIRCIALTHYALSLSFNSSDSRRLLWQMYLNGRQLFSLYDFCTSNLLHL
jgi:hypothetical protein